MIGTYYQPMLVPDHSQVPLFGMPTYTLTALQRFRTLRVWSAKAVILTHHRNGEKAQVARKRKIPDI